MMTDFTTPLQDRSCTELRELALELGIGFDKNAAKTLMVQVLSAGDSLGHLASEIPEFDEMCEMCGEQEADEGGLCMQCIMEGSDDREALLFAFREDDEGIRTCNCEDYPCCGH